MAVRPPDGAQQYVVLAGSIDAGGNLVLPPSGESSGGPAGSEEDPIFIDQVGTIGVSIQRVALTQPTDEPLDARLSTYEGSARVEVGTASRPLITEGRGTRSYNRFLTDLAGAADARDLNVNGSVTPVEFGFIVPEGNVVGIESLRLSFYGSDFSGPGRFFDLLGGLANGILIGYYDDGGALIRSVLPGAYDAIGSIRNRFDLESVGDAMLDTVSTPDRFTVDLRFGGDLVLQENESIRLTVQDNLTSAFTAGHAYARAWIASV